MAIVYDDEQPKRIEYDKPPPSADLYRTEKDLPAGGSAASGFIRGIPIVGPAIEKGTAYAMAAPASLFTGRSISDQAQQYLDINKRIAARDPVQSGIGEVAGSVMSTVPAARAFPRVFGGATMPGQMAAGGVIGGADAAVRSGGDLGEIGKGAAIGGAAPVIGSILAPVGQLASSGARAVVDRTPGLRSVFARPPTPPSAADILKHADDTFNDLGKNVRYDPASLDDLTNLIKRDLYHASRSSKVGATETHKALDTLDSLPANPASLHTIRKELNAISSSSTEADSARRARETIEHFMEAPPANAVIAGHADAATVGQRLRNANADWKAARNDEALRERLTKTMVDTGKFSIPFLSEGEVTRQWVASMLKNNKATKFLEPPDIEALNAVVKHQSLGEGALRLISRATGTARPSWHTTGLGMGGLALDPVSTLGALVGGTAASAGQSLLTRRAAERAGNVIRSQSPYAQSVMAQQVYPRPRWSPNLPSSISPREHRNEIARLLALQAEREAVE